MADDEVTLTVRLLAITSRRHDTRTGEIAVETRCTLGMIPPADERALRELFDAACGRARRLRRELVEGRGELRANEELFT